MRNNWLEEFEDPYFHWGETRKDFLSHITGLCGCGSGKDFKLIEEVFRFCAMDCEDPQRKEKYPKGCYEDVAWELAAKVLDNADLVEHGSGIGWPWLTASGKKALDILNTLPD